jgi:hypothetical protein
MRNFVLFRLAVVTMVLALPAVVQAQYDYTTNNGAITIAEYTGPGGTVIIPGAINGLPVTVIGETAFAGCSGLVGLTIPNSVTNIGTDAFLSDTALTSLTIGNGVASVGGGAFAYCSSLASLTIPNGVTDIANWAFEYCTNLTSVTIGSGVATIGDYAFRGCTNLTGVYFQGSAPGADASVFEDDGTATVYYLSGTTGWGATFAGLPAVLLNPQRGPLNYTTNHGTITITKYTSSGGAVAVPGTINGLPVTRIGEQAFFNCTNLTSVTFPNSLTTIEDSAFAGCTSLATVTFPNSLVSIGDYAFRDCTNLTGVYFQGSAPGAGASVFDGDGRATVYYMFGTAGWGATFAGLPAVLLNPPQGQFSYTTNNGTITIAKYMGSGGTATVPSTINGLLVTCIGEQAFFGCASLDGVIMPNTVTSIEDWAFANCTSLAGVTIPNSVSNIGNSAFYDCSRLTSITIPGSVGNIGDGAFEWCSRLEAITVGPLNSVYSSLDGVLFDKSQTTLLAYPAGKAGTSYTIPASVTRIGDQAFWYCVGLASATIGNSVTEIGDGAFANCPGLTSLYFEGNAPSIGSYVFGGDNDMATVHYLPWTTGWAPAFGGLSTLMGGSAAPAGYTITNGTVTIITYTGPPGAVTIPSMIDGLPVTSIGAQAFYGCARVTSVVIPNSVTSIGTWAFESCSNLASVTIPNSVTNLGEGAFSGCASLASVTIPSSVTSIGSWTFQSCASLSEVYFQGNAPAVDSSAFSSDSHATIYYLFGTTGWGATFGGRPTVLLNPQAQAGIAGVGVRANQFGFNITGSSNLVVVVQASTNLANPTWYPLQTNTLNGASLYFSDPQWTNFASRFYRLTSP